MQFCNCIVLTYERRVSLIPVPDLQVVVLAFPWGAGGLDEEPVSKVDPDEVSRGRGDGPEAGDVRAVLLGIHWGVELHPGRVSVGEILAELLQLLRVVFGFVGRRRRSTLHRRSKSGKTFAFSTRKNPCDNIATILYAVLRRLVRIVLCSCKTTQAFWTA